MAAVVSIALFQSLLGVGPGALGAAPLLDGAGHGVIVVDQYGGEVLDDYREADAFAQRPGYPALMAAVAAVRQLAPPIVVAGFTNGGGISEFVAATTGGVVGAVLLSSPGGSCRGGRPGRATC